MLDRSIETTMEVERADPSPSIDLEVCMDAGRRHWQCMHVGCVWILGGE